MQRRGLAARSWGADRRRARLPRRGDSRRGRQGPQIHVALALSVFASVDRKEPRPSAAHSEVGSRGRSEETRDERIPDAESGGSGARRRRPGSGHRFGGPWPRRLGGGHGSHGGHWHGGRPPAGGGGAA